MIQSLSHGRVLFDSIPSTHDMYNKWKNYPDSLVLTVTQRSVAYINDVILKHIFTNHPLALLVADDETLVPVHKDMKLMITRNVNKSIGFVNGQFVTVTIIQNNPKHLIQNNYCHSPKWSHHQHFSYDKHHQRHSNNKIPCPPRLRNHDF